MQFQAISLSISDLILHCECADMSGRWVSECVSEWVCLCVDVPTCRQLTQQATNPPFAAGATVTQWKRQMSEGSLSLLIAFRWEWGMANDYTELIGCVCVCVTDLSVCWWPLQCLGGSSPPGRCPSGCRGCAPSSARPRAALGPARQPIKTNIKTGLNQSDGYYYPVSLHIEAGRSVRFYNNVVSFPLFMYVCRSVPDLKCAVLGQWQKVHAPTWNTFYVLTTSSVYLCLCMVCFRNVKICFT